MTKCAECSKEIKPEETYRCRICKLNYCEDCSLNHFGLYEENGEVRYKNIFKTILWLLRKRVLGR